MSAREDRDDERREAEEFARRYLDFGTVRAGGRAVVEALRRLFRTPGAAARRFSETAAAAAAPEPSAERVDTERVDEVTRLLDECGIVVTEERLARYADMDGATFETVAAHLRDAYQRARHPLRADAERRAARART